MIASTDWPDNGASRLPAETMSPGQQERDDLPPAVRQRDRRHRPTAADDRHEFRPFLRVQDQTARRNCVHASPPAAARSSHRRRQPPPSFIVPPHSRLKAGQMEQAISQVIAPGVVKLRWLAFLGNGGDVERGFRALDDARENLSFSTLCRAVLRFLQILLSQICQSSHPVVSCQSGARDRSTADANLITST